jgi:hypothetical protein
MDYGKVTKKATCEGVTPIMFDRYPGDNKTELDPKDKMYFKRGSKELVLPAVNVMSFLSAKNTESSVKRFYDSREYKKVAGAILSNVSILPYEIPLMRDGKQIKFAGFDKNGIYLHVAVARLEKGVPNPKERPVIDLPWSLEFEVVIWENKEITEDAIRMLFERGGQAIGFGTWRGQFGKFDFNWS